MAEVEYKGIKVSAKLIFKMPTNKETLVTYAYEIRSKPVILPKTMEFAPVD